ncbi:MAG: hypothetical protein AMXMBFR4_25930 [Candidatus Hydrogenedentota bacterium]
MTYTMCMRPIVWLALALLTCGLQALAQQPRGLASIHVPDGFEVMVAADPNLSSYPMFMAFDHAGRLFIAESSGKDIKGKDMPAHPECTILMLEDMDHDGVFDTRTLFASTLSLPMGVLWYRGALYVASPPDFFRFEDTDDDGVAELRDVILTGWNVLNTASLHGPFLGPDGYMYLTHGRHGYKIATKEGETLEGMAARIWRCKPDGSLLERFCGGGFDNPVELVWTDSADLIGTMTYFTDPRNGQRDALNHWVEGGVYPKPHEVVGEFVRTGDLLPSLTHFSRIAPSGLMVYRGTAFGDEYRGNLFSAQFNPHRVQRHRLSPNGSTYSSDDSDFMTSSDPDFHPTDVIEDADGSLLVSDTGGWYVDACPISRVAKPEMRGAIYRIRKKDAPAVDDAWGAGLHIDQLRTSKLAALLDDPRPLVRDHAFERLVESGEDAVRPLVRLCNNAENPETRVTAVRALAQIGGGRAWKRINEALRDESPAVRQNAAYLAGVLGNSGLTVEITPLLNDSDARVRRAAAATLGRMKDKSAVPALLAACASGNDRFLEHSIIFALIEINEQAPLVEALEGDNPAARKAALIALDQLESPALTERHVVAFLKAEDDDLRRTGLWVASRHPEWSGAILAFVETRLRDTAFAADRAETLREVLLALSRETHTEELVARMMRDESVDAPRKIFLLDVIEKSSVNPLPESWIASIGTALDSPDEATRWGAASVVRSRNLAQFDERLLNIADDASQPAALRVNALGTLVARQPDLSDARLKILLENLGHVDPAVRLESGKVIGKAKLNPAQLRLLASAYLAKADALTFPALLDAFKGGNDAGVGLELVKSLSTAAISPNQIPGGLDALFETFPATVKTAAAPLRAMAEADAAARLEKLAKLEPLLATGDVGRGRQLFFNEKLACSTCHAVGQEGGTLGPDLTTIGTIRSGHDLLEAVLFPSASFVPGYEPFRIEARDPEFGGTQVFVGVIGDQTTEAITLRTAADAESRIPRSDIVSMTQATVSVMPEGLEAHLTQQELLDLLAFMQSLNNEQWLLPERRETASR